MSEETQRQKKVAGLIQKDLSEIMARYFRDLFVGNLVTISAVRVTRDFSLAKVYVSFIKHENRDELMQIIVGHTTHIRDRLAAKIKNQLRKTPELRFYVDDTLDYVEHIDKLLTDIKKS